MHAPPRGTQKKSISTCLPPVVRQCCVSGGEFVLMTPKHCPTRHQVDVRQQAYLHATQNARSTLMPTRACNTIHTQHAHAHACMQHKTHAHMYAGMGSSPQWDQCMGTSCSCCAVHTDMPARSHTQVPGSRPSKLTADKSSTHPLAH